MLGNAVVVIGKGRATQLAVRHPGRSQPFPLYKISQTGRVMAFGQLVPIQAGEWLLEADECAPVIKHGDFKDGLFPGWPWFLEDLRPAGFLGRAFAGQMAKLLNYHPDTQQWSDLQVADALSRFGSNLPGDFVLGEVALDTFQQEKVNHAEANTVHHMPADYPALAELALGGGEDFGSSAGGEQPKFTALIGELKSGSLRSVIVKFSPPMNTTTGRRWVDLLWSEHIANRTLQDYGFSIADTQVLESGGRTFLESTRFDRTPGGGRIGIVSLRALDAAFIGQGGGSWADVARSLHRDGFIDTEVRESMVRLFCFGELIGNTDMHFGNISFFLSDNFPLPLCPVYDMLPMRFRPTGTGEIRDEAFLPRLPRPENEDAWLRMWPIALDYWNRVFQSSEVSRDFKRIAKEAMGALQQLRTIADR